MMGGPTPQRPRLTPVADHALLVEFGEVIDDAAHEAVIGLDGILSGNPCPGMIETVPAYVSLLIDFDPLTTDHQRVGRHVETLLADRATAARTPGRHQIAVCYEGDLAPDLDAVCDKTGLSAEAVIASHLQGNYRVYMYGFAPGYAYLAGVPEALRLDRKPAPRRDLPAGSVMIAGPQCLITTLTMPTGWWVIGRSPARVLTGDPEQPFLFGVGDKVSFRRIGRDEFEKLDQNGQ